MAAPNIDITNNPGKGNPNIMAITVVASLAAAGAATTTNLSLTIPGVLPGDIVLTVVKATAQAGLTLGSNVPVSVANTVQVTLVNPTAGAITPTAGDIYTVVIARFAQTLATYEGFI